MKITILTLFPEMFDSFQSSSIIKKAILNSMVEIEVVNYRDFTADKHQRVDDYPYGGPQGMVLMCQPIVSALENVKTADSTTILITPKGSTFKQHDARMLAKLKHLILVCGHYEGFDERIRKYVDIEISLGDFIMTGGEIGALAISDAVIRLLDGVIKLESHQDESFEEGLLEYPQYTRPIDFNGDLVPEVLISGHHEKIRQWRLKHSLKETYKRRPDLLLNRLFSEEEKKLLQEIETESK